MINQNIYEGINHVVQITTDEEKSCDHCNFRLNNFAESINHYINEHEYKLLHIGQQTTRDLEGNPWQLIVAVLGK